MSLNFAELPLWVTIVKRVVTLLILAALGVHALVQHRRLGGGRPAPERWVFLGFSLMLLVGAILNLGALVNAARYGVRQGPFNYGIYSLLILVLYMIFAYGISRKIRL